MNRSYLHMHAERKHAGKQRCKLGVQQRAHDHLGVAVDERVTGALVVNLELEHAVDIGRLELRVQVAIGVLRAA